VEGIDVKEAAALVERGEAVLLDVRERDEWLAGHAPQATHIPMSELGERLTELPDEQRLLALCRSGNRSGQVTAALQERGYRITNVCGGMKSWVKVGLPLEPPTGTIA